MPHIRGTIAPCFLVETHKLSILSSADRPGADPVVPWRPPRQVLQRSLHRLRPSFATGRVHPRRLVLRTCLSAQRARCARTFGPPACKATANVFRRRSGAWAGSANSAQSVGFSVPPGRTSRPARGNPASPARPPPQQVVRCRCNGAGVPVADSSMARRRTSPVKPPEREFLGPVALRNGRHRRSGSWWPSPLPVVQGDLTTIPDQPVLF